MSSDESFLHDALLGAIDIDRSNRPAVLRLIPHESYPQQQRAIQDRLAPPVSD
jgi:hypothetical protein